MKRCPITSAMFEGEGLYSPEGLRQLSPRLASLSPLPFTKQGLLHEAAVRATKMSIQGVQPKLSGILQVQLGSMEIVDNGGQYILKPDHPYFPQIPENEDLTMRLAAAAGLHAPLHGLLYTESGEWCYFIKRFDRAPKKQKLAMEDMAQLTAHTRDTKYKSSIEKVAKALDTFCTFPALEKVQLFTLVLVSFLTGNGDMHLKNFTLLTDAKGIVRLSPAYDQVNTRLAMGKAEIEQFALTLRGKRNRLTRSDLLEYLAFELLNLAPKVNRTALERLEASLAYWPAIIEVSFLTDERKEAYLAIVRERAAVLGWQV